MPTPHNSDDTRSRADIRTAGSVVAVTAVFLTIVLLVQYRQNRQYPGLGLLAGAQAVSLLAFGSAFFTISPLLAPAVALVSVSSTVLSLLLVYAGLTAFLQRRVPWRWLGAYAGLALVAFGYLVIVSPNTHARRATTYVLVAGVLVALVIMLVRHHTVYARWSVTFLRTVFAVAALYYVVLAGLAVTQADDVPGFWISTPIVVMAYLGAVVLMLMWTFGLVFAVAEHLRYDLEEDRENLRRIFQATPDAMAITRMSDAVIVDVNDGFTRLFGLDSGDIVGRPAGEHRLWVRPEDRTRMLQELSARSVLREFAATLVTADGVQIDVAISARMLRRIDGAHVITVMRDVSERSRLERELRRQALTDDLTGTANRRAFLAALGEQLGQSALVVLDLDGFKTINDTLGHAAGDRLVCLLAQVAEDLLPPGGVVGRLGGDEFGVILPHMSERAAAVWAEHLLTAIREVTFSAGVAVEGSTVDEVMATADRALYEAKRRGRNCVVCAEDQVLATSIQPVASRTMPER